MIKQSDSLEFLKSCKDFEFDINYSDPPYALGSEVIIRPDGKVDYKKANDFMNKWEMPTGEYWEQWFKEAYRTLKYGGYVIMFGMDRQLLLFKYYANLAGFIEQQSLYWYFISNFPKASDLSKMIDKNAGAERKVVGKGSAGFLEKNNSFEIDNEGYGSYDLTAPSTDLAKKYDGYKYSISPLKQTNETILVFQKPYKTGSCLRDTLAFENGDLECCCGALDIDGNRVETKDDLSRINKEDNGMFGVGNNNNKAQQLKEQGLEYGGRYPSQTFIDSQVAEVLDKQSGVSKSTGGRIGNKGSDLNMTGTNYEKGDAGYGDIAGCSKILHKCDFTEQELVYIDFENDADYVWSELTNQWKDEKELRNWLDDYFMKDISIDFDFKKYQRVIVDSDRKIIVPLIKKCDYEEDEYDIYNYQPKVSQQERNAGCEGEEKQYSHDGRNKETETPYQRNKSIAKNNHPTLKPIALNEKILKLFKAPNEQKIIYPFAGAGSEIIGGIRAGFDDWVGCELSKDYVEIATARIDYWQQYKDIDIKIVLGKKNEDKEDQTTLFDF